jgi:hypothetical protein
MADNLKELKVIGEPQVALIGSGLEGDPMLAQFFQERAAFRKQLPELLKTCPGQYVAVYQGRVIDQDKDEFALARRMDIGYRHEFVLIEKVSIEEDEIRMESPGPESP